MLLQNVLLVFAAVVKVGTTSHYYSTSSQALVVIPSPSVKSSSCEQCMCCV